MRQEESENRDSGTQPILGAETSPLILFADDSAVQTLKLRELLKDAGYRVLATADGTAALRAAERSRPNLILLDLEMPGLNGVETCKALKQNKSLAPVPVLMLTAHEDPQHLVAAFAAGCVGYIVKGTPDSVLLEKLARHCVVQDAAIR